MAEGQDIDVLSESESEDRSDPFKSEGRTRKSRLQQVRQRIRDPFNKKKLKELRQMNNALQATYGDIVKNLFRMVSSNPRGQSLIGPVDSLQIGCTNIIHHGSEYGFTGKQEQIDKLAEAANKRFEELTTESERRAGENTDIKLSLERSEIKLEELKDLVSQCSSKISQQDVTHSQALKDLKAVQEAMLTSLPDDKVVSDGISAIRTGLVFDDEYDFLPFPTKILVTRLVHLFGHRGLDTLCKSLHMEIDDDVVERVYDDESISSDCNIEMILNKEVCATVIVKWVNKSLDNDSNALLQVIDSHQKQRYLQIKEELTNTYITSEDKYVQTVNQDENLTKQFQSLSSLSGQDNTSSDKSLSMDENYYTYSSLEMDALHLLKVLSVEGIAA